MRYSILYMYIPKTRWKMSCIILAFICEDFTLSNYHRTSHADLADPHGPLTKHVPSLANKHANRLVEEPLSMATQTQLHTPFLKI